MASACLCQTLRKFGAASAPLATRTLRIAPQRGLSSGGATHWSKDRAKVNSIKEYGTYATIGVFVAGVGVRGYQWYDNATPPSSATMCSRLVRPALTLVFQHATKLARAGLQVHWSKM